MICNIIDVVHLGMLLQRYSEMRAIINSAISSVQELFSMQFLLERHFLTVPLSLQFWTTIRTVSLEYLKSTGKTYRQKPKTLLWRCSIKIGRKESLHKVHLTTSGSKIHQIQKIRLLRISMRSSVYETNQNLTRNDQYFSKWKTL